MGKKENFKHPKNTILGSQERLNKLWNKNLDYVYKKLEKKFKKIEKLLTKIKRR